MSEHKICEEHWKMMRDEVTRLELDKYVGANGEIAAMRLVDQLQTGEDSQMNYDPLMSAYFMIFNRALDIAGFRVMHPDFGCIICEFYKMRGPEGECICGNPECPNKGQKNVVPDFVDWLTGPESALVACKEYMKEKGWLDDGEKAL